MPSILRVRRLQGNEYADIVSVRRQGDLFVAVCRDEKKCEATATNAEQSLAIIHAAMKLIDPDVTPSPETEWKYVIESNNSMTYRLPPKEDKPARPAWIANALNFTYQVPPRIAYAHLFEPKWITREERDNDGT